MAAAGGPGPERLEGLPGPGELSPAAPGESPGPEVLDGPGEPAEPRPAEPQPCEVQEPEPSEPSEPQVAAGPPGPSEPPGPSVAEGPSGPSESPEPWEPPEPPGSEIAEGPPGPSEAAPAAGGAGEEAAASISGNGAADETPPIAQPEEAAVPPGEAERRSGEAAGEAAAEQRDVAEEGEEERRERAELLEQHRGLAGERERLRQASARLQLRLGELLRLRRGEGPRAEAGADGPQRYGERLRRLQELREQREREAAACREREAARRRGGEERQARAQAEWAAFQARKKAVAVFSLGRRLGGREAAARAVERIQAREGDKEQQVREARVENIKLKHEIQTLETILKAQGELAEGQHFMDFEHMKKENQKHSEKIDDLTEEILKLKKKVSKAVHILSQFREKLQFVEAENQDRKAELMDIETVLAQKRDILTKTKKARDRLRRNNLKLQQKCGLLGNEILLRDFEEKVDTAELLSQQLETLKRHHAGVILTCSGIQKKIKEANSSFLAEDDQRKERMGKNKLRSFP
ncbi:coiled-coil domain-containing protein 96 [Chroicocephalus ridibundus]|uniref:coiled-coil domain-containing protein 96 n=1 Tax=Chroicocephalus ridibundus TaxID=1192867 RepID=UPI002FDDC4A5